LIFSIFNFSQSGNFLLAKPHFTPKKKVLKAFLPKKNLKVSKICHEIYYKKIMNE
jgi:hypothetical protein